MELIETVIDEESVQLTFSDAPPGIHGDRFLQVRMPVEAAEKASLAFVRVTALQKAYDFLQGEIKRLHNVIG